MKRLRVEVCLVLAGLVSLSCGTLQMNLQTTVETSGDITQEVKLVANGLIAAAAQQDPLVDAEAARKEGWEVQSQASADYFEQTLRRTFRRSETLDMVLLPDVFSSGTATEGMAGGEPRITYYMRDLILIKDYDLRIQIPPSPGVNEEVAGLGGEADQAAMAMIETMLSISWTITVPGEIVSTNADRWEKNSATWDLSLTTLEKGRQLDLKARYTNWPLIIGAGAGIVVLVIGMVLGVRFFGRRKREVHQAPGIGE